MQTTTTRAGSIQPNGDGDLGVSIGELLAHGYAGVTFFVEEAVPVRNGSFEKVMADVTDLVRDCCPEGVEEEFGPIEIRTVEELMSLLRDCGPENRQCIEKGLRRLASQYASEYTQIARKIDTRNWHEKAVPEAMRGVMQKVTKYTKEMDGLLEAIQKRFQTSLSADPMSAHA